MVKAAVKSFIGKIQAKRFQVQAGKNVYIGKHCVIGANSVVTKDVPDYCVAVGSPARVIKKM
jgi:carbonic anhydrase/acetyltransferase-like protein (isoleucine patch superfamily)